MFMRAWIGGVAAAGVAALAAGLAAAQDMPDIGFESVGRGWPVEPALSSAGRDPLQLQTYDRARAVGPIRVRLHGDDGEVAETIEVSAEPIEVAGLPESIVRALEAAGNVREESRHELGLPESIVAVLAEHGHPDPPWYEVPKSKKAPKKPTTKTSTKKPAATKPGKSGRPPASTVGQPSAPRYQTTADSASCPQAEARQPVIAATRFEPTKNGTITHSARWKPWSRPWICSTSTSR